MADTKEGRGGIVRRVILGVVLAAVIAVIGWAYSYVPPMTDRASEEWSRGRFIGQTSVNQPVALRPAPDGGAYLVWSNTDGWLELAHISADGEVLSDRVLAIGAGMAGVPQLQVGADGRLHVLWREGGDPHATVRYARIEADGTPVGETQILSDPAHWVVDAPRLVSVAGQIHALWADEAGLHWAVLSSEGVLVREPTLLPAEGAMPAVQADEAGQLHVVWLREAGTNLRSVYYAVLNPQTGELSPPEELTQVFRRVGRRVEGLSVGLDAENVYVLWSIQDRRDGSAETAYVFFPIGSPDQMQETVLDLREGFDVLGISTLDGQRAPLTIVLSEMVRVSVQRSELQIAVATVTGRLAVEDCVTASGAASQKPTLVMDDESYLHLAWLETGRAGFYRVTYASTAPGVMATYNVVTLWDVVDSVLSAVVQSSLAVLALVPMLFLWVVGPLLGLLVFHVATGEEGLETVRARVVSGATLGLVVVLTMLFPFRVPTTWPWLRCLSPLVTAVLSALVTVAVLRRRDREDLLFTSFFLFAGVHCVLQLLTYLLFSDVFAGLFAM
jgi:hypothetical protein